MAGPWDDVRVTAARWARERAIDAAVREGLRLSLNHHRMPYYLPNVLEFGAGRDLQAFINQAWREQHA